MWNRLNLRIRIYMILSSLVFITLLGGLVIVWYTYRMEGLLTGIIDEDVAAYQAAEALKIALINQKGFVSYYFLDGDPEWLRQLQKYRGMFSEQIDKTRALVKDREKEQELIRQIGVQHTIYINAKDQVIEHYKAGDRKEGVRLHQEVRDHFSRLFDLCEAYKNIHITRIRQAKEKSQAQSGKLRIITGIAIFTEFSLGGLLAFMLIHHVLGPVRKLTLEADKKDGRHPSGDEIEALSRTVQGLIKDAGKTQLELERSRVHLLQAEKMAMIGKLAAGMAHSIRNPLTSVKMRLFSLSRSLNLSVSQKEDFEVISEEIRHIDTIVQNFLEFSRPPKLKMQQISPSGVVDLAIQLLAHRLKSYDVNVRIIRNHPLPETQADPEQLKEVLVNLTVNACEAMENGGLISIYEEVAFVRPLGNVTIIRMSDNGPGIPRAIREKVFEPFFTTKEEGTGLGLSIAFRIIEEHGGWLNVTSEGGLGTTFVITLPVVQTV